MPLITDLYRAQQAKLHRDRDDYGMASVHFAPLVRSIIDRLDDVVTIVDYGAGKGRLGEALMKDPPSRAIALECYDPAIDDISEAPSPADMVVCIDVLEHIEPECLQEVLADIKRCAKKYLLTTIHCGPAMKKLSDGRNAHLIQAPPAQWCNKFWMLGYTLKSYGESPGGFWALWQSPHTAN